MSTSKRKRTENSPPAKKTPIKDAPSDRFFKKSALVLTIQNGVPKCRKRMCQMLDEQSIIGYATFHVLLCVCCVATQMFKTNDRSRKFPFVYGNLYEFGGFLAKNEKAPVANENKKRKKAAIAKKINEEKIASVRNLNYVEESRVVCLHWEEGIACKCYKQCRAIILEEIQMLLFDNEFKESEKIPLFGIGYYSSESVKSGNEEPVYDRMFVQAVICGHKICVSDECICDIMLILNEGFQQNLTKALNEPKTNKILTTILKKKNEAFRCGIDDIYTFLRSHNKPELRTGFFKEKGYRISPIPFSFAVINRTMESFCRVPQYKKGKKTSKGQISSVRQNAEKFMSDALNTIPQLTWPTLADHINETTIVCEKQNLLELKNQFLTVDGNAELKEYQSLITHNSRSTDLSSHGVAPYSPVLSNVRPTQICSTTQHVCYEIAQNRLQSFVFDNPQFSSLSPNSRSNIFSNTQFNSLGSQFSLFAQRSSTSQFDQINKSEYFLDSLTQLSMTTFSEDSLSSSISSTSSSFSSSSSSSSSFTSSDEDADMVTPTDSSFSKDRSLPFCAGQSVGLQIMNINDDLRSLYEYENENDPLSIFSETNESLPFFCDSQFSRSAETDYQ